MAATLSRVSTPDIGRGVPTVIDPTGGGFTVQLPPQIRRWANFYVALDPWAYIAAPAFTLADEG